MENGAAVCEPHHRQAEEDILTPDALRRWCGIQVVHLPSHFPGGATATKWGRILDAPLASYPRTPYLPSSAQAAMEQRLDDITHLVHGELVVTIKMDGANVKLTHERVTARNGEHASGRLFDRLKAMHASGAWEIPQGLEVFGEWLEIAHGTHYVGPLRLSSRLQVFAARRGSEWLSWEDTVGLGLPMVPLITTIDPRGQSARRVEAQLASIAETAIEAGHEGIVVRSAHSFYDGQFAERTAKYVRAGYQAGALFDRWLANEVGA